MARPGVSVSFHGPVFRSGGSAVHEAGKKAVSDIVAEGERDVKLQLRPGHGLDTGHYRRSINGEQPKDLQGIIHDNNVVYGPWLEGVSSRNQRSRFKGYRMFRNAAERLQGFAKDAIGRRVGEAVRRLNGGF